MLLPAHRLILEGGRERIERYWSLSTGRHTYVHDLPLRRAVDHSRKRSGGIRTTPNDFRRAAGSVSLVAIDSSLLVSMMARQVTGKRVKTFSVGFEAEGRGNG
jgi:asparagine synthetase B (glutamine-hydrolysing)